MKKQFKSTLVPLLTAFLLLSLFSASTMDCSQQENNQSASQNQQKVVSPEQAKDLLQMFSLAFEDAAQKVSSSVVPIFAEQEIKMQNPFNMPDSPFRDFFGDDFFKRFFGAPQQQDEKQTVRSMGSGVIISKDGYILTNNHVVEGADKLTILIGENKRYSAKIIGTDPQTDVGVIKIDADDLPAANLGNSDEVRVGQWVIAVGNPFQLLHTVTAGIISAKGRSSVGLADYEDFIQTDASINPGNSGGALCDLDGNVIGINTAISSPSGGNVGIGFAIPINMARRVMDQLLDSGKVTRGYLAMLPQDIDENLAKALKLTSSEGCLVGDVTPDGPADKGGLKQGDVIVEMNGQKLSNSTQLRNNVAQTKPGTNVKFRVVRDGKKLDLTVALGERPSDVKGRMEEQRQPEQQTGEQLGMMVQTLTPEIAQQLGYKNETGVVVVNIASGSPAEEAGLQQGDLVKEVNRKKIDSVTKFTNELKNAKSGESIALLVRRGANTFFLAIQIPK